MVAVEQVGVLQPDGDAVGAGRWRAAVVHGDEAAQRLVVGHGNRRRDLARLAAGLEGHIGLLRRILVGQRQLARHVGRVRHAAVGQSGQAGADVLFVVVFGALQRDFGQLGFQNFQHDGAATQFLFRNADLGCAEAALVVGGLQCGARRFELSEADFGAGIGRQHGVDFPRPENRSAGQRVGAHLEAGAVGTLLGARRRTTTGLHRCTAAGKVWATPRTPSIFKFLYSTEFSVFVCL